MRDALEQLREPVDKILTPQTVDDLLRRSRAVPRSQRLSCSRFVLLACYDATHSTKATGEYHECALMKARPHLELSREVCIPHTAELYAKLTGDSTTPAEALGSEARAIAKKVAATT